MKSSRILTVALTLAALLVGNVAGWVHVGCSGHSAACCQSNRHTVCKTAPQKHDGHFCCHHDHQVDVQVDVQGQSLADNSCSEPSEGESDNQHDSDRCSICQSFFASRHAVVIADDAALAELLTTSREVVLVEDVLASDHLSQSHTARGPPSV